jgi:hypothetical protein
VTPQPRRRRLGPTAAVVLAATDIGAPAAAARPVGESQPIESDAGAASATPVLISPTGGGLDWGSAGLGVGVAGAVAVLSLGAAAKHRDRAAHPPTLRRGA